MGHDDGQPAKAPATSTKHPQTRETPQNPQKHPQKHPPKPAETPRRNIWWQKEKRKRRRKRRKSKSKKIKLILNYFII